MLAVHSAVPPPTSAPMHTRGSRPEGRVREVLSPAAGGRVRDGASLFCDMKINVPSVVT